MKLKINIYIFSILLAFISIQGRGQQMVTFSKYKVGDTIPDFEFENLTNYPVTNKKLSEFKEKLVIIDFWATWCAPCLAMLPKMDSLMAVNKDDLLFISATKESKEKAESFLKKYESNTNHRFSMPVIYGDKDLFRIFPHYYLPHYVWINPQSRKVIAITNHKEVNQDNIKAYLKTGENKIKTTKIDTWLAYNDTKDPMVPFLYENSDLRKIEGQYSFFSNYVPNLKNGIFANDHDSTQSARIVVKNLPIKHLFSLAYGEGRRFFNDASITIESKDSTRIDLITDTPKSVWEVTNCYNYEVYLPFSKKDRMFTIMREDLKRHITKYVAEIQKRKARCWVLTSTGDNSSLRTKGGKWSVVKDQFGYHAIGQPLDDFIVDMNFYYDNKGIIVTNDVNVDFYVDLDLSVDKGLRDLEDVNKALAKYNLKFEDKITETDILVIKDAM